MNVLSEMRSGLRDIAVASRIFLILAVLALTGAVGLLAWHQGAFTKTIKVSFVAGTADGMNTGMVFNRTTGAITNLPTALGGNGGRFGFGSLTGTRDPRRIQLAAKIYF